MDKPFKDDETPFLEGTFLKPVICLFADGTGFTCVSDDQISSELPLIPVTNRNLEILKDYPDILVFCFVDVKTEVTNEGKAVYNLSNFSPMHVRAFHLLSNEQKLSMEKQGRITSPYSFQTPPPMETVWAAFLAQGNATDSNASQHMFVAPITGDTIVLDRKTNQDITPRTLVDAGDDSIKRTFDHSATTSTILKPLALLREDGSMKVYNSDVWPELPDRVWAVPSRDVNLLDNCPQVCAFFFADAQKSGDQTTLSQMSPMHVLATEIISYEEMKQMTKDGTACIFEGSEFPDDSGIPGEAILSGTPYAVVGDVNNQKILLAITHGTVVLDRESKQDITPVAGMAKASPALETLDN